MRTAAISASLCFCPSRSSPPCRGQAAVEAAIVMPIMVFLVLGIIQFTSLHQAKLLTEYAAFQAARAGIVWNGDNRRMHDAALFAVLPTLGSTRNVEDLARAWVQAEATDQILNSLPWGGPVSADINGSPLKGLIRVDTVNPAHFSQIDQVWKVEGGSNWKELDFDGVETYPEHPQLSRYFSNFYSPGALPRDDDVLRKASVLSIRVRYLYELKIPFANWIIFACWYAANAGIRLAGPLERPDLQSPLVGAASGVQNRRGYDSLYPSEMSLLWRIATSAFTPLNGRRYFFPLTAEYSMRMQSNFYRKWIVHEQPGWEL